MTDQPPRRTWDTGLVRPYRATPIDFRDVFIRMGQGKEIEEHYRTNWRVIRRWIEECGGDDLRQERARHSGGFVRPLQRSGRYAMGRTLTAVRTRAVKPVGDEG